MTHLEINSYLKTFETDFKDFESRRSNRTKVVTNKWNVLSLYLADHNNDRDFYVALDPGKDLIFFRCSYQVGEWSDDINYIIKVAKEYLQWK
jgi:hypothetical protein